MQHLRPVTGLQRMIVLPHRDACDRIATPETGEGIVAKGYQWQDCCSGNDQQGYCSENKQWDYCPEDEQQNYCPGNKQQNLV